MCVAVLTPVSSMVQAYIINLLKQLPVDFDRVSSVAILLQPQTSDTLKCRGFLAQLGHVCIMNLVVHGTIAVPSGRVKCR